MKGQRKRNLHRNVVLGIAAAVALMISGCGLGDLPQKVTREDSTGIVVAADEDSREVQASENEAEKKGPEEGSAEKKLTEEDPTGESPESAQGEEPAEKDPEEGPEEAVLSDSAEDNVGSTTDNDDSTAEGGRSHRHSGSSKPASSSQPAAPSAGEQSGQQNEAAPSAGEQSGQPDKDEPSAGEQSGQPDKDEPSAGEQSGQPGNDSKDDTSEQQKPEIPPHVHEYEVTGRVEATCSEAGSVTYTCIECGDSYEEALAVTAHTPGEWTVKTEATEEAEGLEVLACTECGAEIESRVIEKLEHVHSYTEEQKEATCTEAGYIIRTCEVCGDTQLTILEPTGHQESGYIVDAEADCEHDGEQHTECLICGALLKTETIPASGHREGDLWIVDQEASCGEHGQQHTECTVCGRTIRTETIPALGHDYGDWIVDQEPTEESAGTRHKECANCGHTITEEIAQLPAHEHIYHETARQEATCTEAGSVTYTCEECGDSYEETLAVTAHTPGEWTVKTEATEEAEGLEVLVCTECGGEIGSRVIDKLEHVHSYTEEYEAPTCTQDGYMKKTCQCGDVIYEVIPAAGHQYGEAKIVEPTCEAEGSSVITCEICGHEEETVLNKIGHSFEWVNTKEPELGVEGSRAYQCKNCGYVEKTEPIDMLLTDGKDSVYWIDLGNGEQTMIIGHYDETASEEMFDLINEYRTENGLKALSHYDSLGEYANIRAREASYLWGHERPSGKELKCGENILSAGTGTSIERCLDAWKNSPGHNNNMLNSGYKYMEVKVFWEKSVKTSVVTGKETVVYTQCWSTLFSGYEYDWTQAY